ncbi:hypothetical protein WKG92_19820 [Pantoea agglomerans]|uniref:hypothetical protein n=1 Tax=Enterobacter agglomerans TaxID=549 RepID=UPI003C797EBA
MTKYIFSPKVSIKLQENSTVQPDDLEVALIAAVGYEPEDVDGIRVWSNGRERFWLASEVALPQNETERKAAVEDVNQKTNARPIVPSMDLAFSQRLMRLVPMAITPETFVNGSLSGHWRVDHVSRFNPYDINSHGIISGKLQPVDVRSTSLPLAVGLLFLSVIGFGQVAYIFLPDNESQEPQLIYLTPANEERVLSSIPATMLFRAEGLDKYAIVGADPDMVRDAVETAKLRRTILLADLKSAATAAPAPAPAPADQPAAELVASAPQASSISEEAQEKTVTDPDQTTQAPLAVQ